jgi:hypothetical protein
MFVRLCYVCHLPYVPYWQAEGRIVTRDVAGKKIGRERHGHALCFMREFEKISKEIKDEGDGGLGW